MAKPTIKEPLVDDGSVYDPALELTAEEKSIARAAIEREVKEELRKKAVLRFRDQVKLELARRHDPEQQLYTIRIELPMSCREVTPFIWLDGLKYEWGQHYAVSKAVFDTLREIIWRAHLADAVQQGRRAEREYRSKSNTILSGVAHGA